MPAALSACEIPAGAAASAGYGAGGLCGAAGISLQHVAGASTSMSMSAHLLRVRHAPFSAAHQWASCGHIPQQECKSPPYTILHAVFEGGARRVMPVNTPMEGHAVSASTFAENYSCSKSWRVCKNAGCTYYMYNRCLIGALSMPGSCVCAEFPRDFCSASCFTLNFISITGLTYRPHSRP